MEDVDERVLTLRLNCIHRPIFPTETLIFKMTRHGIPSVQAAYPETSSLCSTIGTGVPNGYTDTESHVQKMEPFLSVIDPGRTEGKKELALILVISALNRICRHALAIHIQTGALGVVKFVSLLSRRLQNRSSFWGSRGDLERFLNVGTGKWGRHPCFTLRQGVDL